MIKLEAINLRDDYEYLRINEVEWLNSTRFALLWKCKGGSIYREQNEWFKTLQGAKSYATKNIQNPKWNMPKLKWKQID